MLQQVPSAYPDPWCPTFRYVDCHYPRVAPMVSPRKTRGITADTHQWPLLAGASPSGHPPCRLRQPRRRRPAKLRGELVVRARRDGHARSNSSATSTPAGWIGTSASCSPICTPASAPSRVRSLKWPRWPIRNTLPASLPRPAPSDMSKRSKMRSRTLSASCSSDSSTAVTDAECSRSSTHTTARPHARTAALAAAAWRGVSREYLRKALVVEHRQRLLQPVQQVGGWRVWEEPVPVALEDWPPVPVRLGQARAGR